MENTDLNKMLNDIREAIQFMNKTGDVSAASRDVLTAAMDDVILVAASVSPKLVMPSEDTNNEMFSNRAYYKDGFNACLSELRRLNPSLFK